MISKCGAMFVQFLSVRTPDPTTFSRRTSTSERRWVRRYSPELMVPTWSFTFTSVMPTPRRYPESSGPTKAFPPLAWNAVWNASSERLSSRCCSFWVPPNTYGLDCSGMISFFIRGAPVVTDGTNHKQTHEGSWQVAAQSGHRRCCGNRVRIWE